MTQMTQPASTGQALGVDVGGSGVKGAIVDLATGEFVGDRVRIDTPQPATPEAIAATTAQIVERLGWAGPVGVTVPAVVTGGIVRTAANIDKSWIGTDAATLFSEALDGRPVAVLNDADAAGLAEDRYGAGREHTGVTILLTFGTGIGSAVLNNGVLLPNTEFGHFEVKGKAAEKRAAASVRKRKHLSWKKWSKRVSKVLIRYEDLFWPDLFIAGGGVSSKADKWIPRLTNRTPVIPATLLNTAGIVGAAMASSAMASTPVSNSATEPEPKQE